MAVLALLDAGDTAGAVGARLAGLALLALVAAVVLGWRPLVPAAVLLLAAAYAVHLAVDDPPLDARAALVAAALLVTAELGYWAVEERDQLPGDAGVAWRRAALVALLGLGAVVTGAALVVLADLAGTRGLAVDLAGAAAAAAALLVLVLLGRRGREG